MILWLVLAAQTLAGLPWSLTVLSMQLPWSRQHPQRSVTTRQRMTQHSCKIKSPYNVVLQLSKSRLLPSLGNYPSNRMTVTAAMTQTKATQASQMFSHPFLRLMSRWTVDVLVVTQLPALSRLRKTVLCQSQTPIDLANLSVASLYAPSMRL